MSTTILHKKICLLGMFGVGKTSLVRRFVYDRFEDEYLSTIGVKVTQKTMASQNSPGGSSTQFNFLIWDVEGLEKDSSVNMNYFMGAAGALVVGDLTRTDSIKSIPDIAADFLQAAPDAAILLIANKTDLITGERESQPTDLLKETAKKMGCPFLLTSAKTGDNVEAGFVKMAELLMAV